MKKKLIATLLLLTLTMTTALTGCGSGDKETAGDNVSSGVESNDNIDVNNNIDSSAETDTTKQEETEEIEYSEDDIIIELNGAKFSIYDEWTSIEPKLQAAGFDTSLVMSDDRITNNFIDGDKLYIQVSLYEADNGLFIRSLNIDEQSGNKSILKKIKINGYNMLETDKIIEKFQFEDGKDDGFVTSDIKLNTSVETTRISWSMVRHLNK